MKEDKTYSSYAVLHELSRREFRKKLDLFPAELRHYVILAAGIIGAENAKRIEETPAAVAKDGKDFAAELLDIVRPEQDDAFREVLETYLVETMKDELRFCCANCSNFDTCIDLDNLSVGLLFKERSEGQDSDELKKEMALQVDHALQETPYLETDSAHIHCKDFRHQYTASSIGDVFNRYADIAAELQLSQGIDYIKIQQEMISLNMDFYAKYPKQ
ncbi:MAG: hypothetical protein Q8K68_09670 [Nitrospirota bacterium]|nr:hypothetical protein [Nitrospirota bacterium]